MNIQRTAFLESLLEMRNSYSADLQMISNYGKTVSTDMIPIGDHIELLKSQLSLMIETIEEMMKR